MAWRCSTRSSSQSTAASGSPPRTEALRYAAWRAGLRGAAYRQVGRASASRSPGLTGRTLTRIEPQRVPPASPSGGPVFSKVLVANRGEIAVRAFRAATELGAKTVAVFPYEDRKSEHVLKADEAYQIGDVGHPVRAYLDPEGIVRTAVEAGADAVYPGYGFLSENPELAEACAAAGITFIGPPAPVLHLTGNKARAIAAAKEAGLP